MYKTKKFKTAFVIAALSAVSMLFYGCYYNTDNESSTVKNTDTIETLAPEKTELSEAATSAYNEETRIVTEKNEELTDEDNNNQTESTNSQNIFTERDLLHTPDLSDAETITLSDNSNITIDKEGIYYLSGTAKNFTVTVNADKKDKIQLVLDNVSISNDNFPVVYVISADKCFITTTDSNNSLSVNENYTSDGDTNTDAVIYSKDDIVFNGTGTLDISSPYGNGISAKDDFKATGGIYNINCALDGIEANDSISICGGEFNITSQKDAIHCENNDDNTSGSVYIEDGTFNLSASSDGIQATTTLQIDGGNFRITSAEGLEGTYIQINGGDIYIEAYDDGINAALKSNAYDVLIEFNGGNITIIMGSGDTDAVDANGSIIVNGGTIDITAPTSSFDYDNTAQYNGGTIIINGTQVDSIPQSMMGGRGGNGGGFRNKRW
ncbi:MAG: carbohydrate-binding domain-containing protein [Oscillospiraceae bacterium]